MTPPTPFNQTQPVMEPVTFLTDKEVLVNATKRIPAPMLPAVCYGRVHDPEERVSKTWWRDSFDHLYLQTDGDVVEDPAITMEEIRRLESHETIRSILQKKSVSHDDSNEKTRILDLCCGQGRHVLRLAELYPHLELHGHDLSKYLVELAQTRAKVCNAADRTHFTIGDCRSVPHPDNTFSLVMVMGNSFGYFTADDENKDIIKEIHRVLKPGGCVIIDIPDGAFIRNNFSARGWEWIDDSVIVCRERQLSKDQKRLICREVVMSTNTGIIRDQFYSERLYDLDEVHQLYRDTGLELQEEQQDGFQENDIGKDMSKRGEDLGMMEKRQLMVAFKPL
ncbi:hypothetical protein BG011_003025 [Mortierella polycephala]|uniref:Methyltransferase domain-containing protein n=1 Tax=Mortierella polycephala TaxID=41804 RepID=A0A9P6U456_9FUNG|nr:hypothetical protein BG011_003025 [Mortierella polycephala]